MRVPRLSVPRPSRAAARSLATGTALLAAVLATVLPATPAQSAPVAPQSCPNLDRALQDGDMNFTTVTSPNTSFAIAQDEAGKAARHYGSAAVAAQACGCMRLYIDLSDGARYTRRAAHARDADEMTAALGRARRVLQTARIAAPSCEMARH